MDPEALAILEADLGAQLDHIDSVYRKIDERKAGAQADPICLEALGYQLHNLFCAFEDAFKIIGSHFENRVAESDRWHAEFLRRMKQEIEGVRPAVISEEVFDLLDELRAFRHVFRHAYGRDLEYEKARIALDKAEQLRQRYQGRIILATWPPYDNIPWTLAIGRPPGTQWMTNMGCIPATRPLLSPLLQHCVLTWSPPPARHAVSWAR